MFDQLVDVTRVNQFKKDPVYSYPKRITTCNSVKILMKFYITDRRISKTTPHARAQQACDIQRAML
jgi:hypothetical protein